MVRSSEQTSSGRSTIKAMAREELQADICRRNLSPRVHRSGSDEKCKTGGNGQEQVYGFAQLEVGVRMRYREQDRSERALR